MQIMVCSTNWGKHVSKNLKHHDVILTMTHCSRKWNLTYHTNMLHETAILVKLGHILQRKCPLIFLWCPMLFCLSWHVHRDHQWGTEWRLKNDVCTVFVSFYLFIYVICLLGCLLIYLSVGWFIFVFCVLAPRGQGGGDSAPLLHHFRLMSPAAQHLSACQPQRVRRKTPRARQQPDVKQHCHRQVRQLLWCTTCRETDRWERDRQTDRWGHKGVGSGAHLWWWTGRAGHSWYAAGSAAEFPRCPCSSQRSLWPTSELHTTPADRDTPGPDSPGWTCGGGGVRRQKFIS